LRLKEAAKLGFKRAYVPAGTKSGTGLELHPVESVVALAALAGGQNGPKRAAGKSLPEHP
jgi:predicted ATP-dependent serine protease